MIKTRWVQSIIAIVFLVTFSAVACSSTATTQKASASTTDAGSGLSPTNSPTDAGSEAPRAWIDLWRDATVSIGTVQDVPQRAPNGEVLPRRMFVPIATGFIAGATDGSGFPYLVTAKHVFLDS